MSTHFTDSLNTVSPLPAVDHDSLRPVVKWRTWQRRTVGLLAGVVILKVTVGIVLNYRNYLPPSFQSDFLRGREAYFWDGYHWAFYAHIVAGPLTIIIGMILLNERFRIRFPIWHRYLGRIQGVCVLLLLVPSGLWMAFYAETGAVAGAGFAALAFATGLCFCRGWIAAVSKRFREHRRWMSRCYVLLCSAVVLRLSAGLAIVTGIESEWTYPLTAWTCWLVPLGVYELIQSSRLAPRDEALQRG